MLPMLSEWRHRVSSRFGDGGTRRFGCCSTVARGDRQPLLGFSDVYVRTPTGWRYVFGQASLALPASLQR